MARQLSLDDTTSPLVPERPSLPKLRKAAAGCTACDLYKDATQTVFGEGTRSAEVMFVGEQPGDQEDKAGKPFVGPAGRLFDEALEDAGIDRTQVYVTNAVKHFK
jgi:uracil-DNA glycosylase family 4